MSERAESAVELPKHGGARRGEGNQGSDTTLKGRRDADYLTARIKRDRPDIFQLHVDTRARPPVVLQEAPASG